jgi:hypothetical protein
MEPLARDAGLAEHRARAAAARAEPDAALAARQLQCAVAVGLAPVDAARPPAPRQVAVPVAAVPCAPGSVAVPDLVEAVAPPLADGHVRRYRLAVDWPRSPPIPRNHANHALQSKMQKNGPSRPSYIVADFRRAAHDYSRCPRHTGDADPSTAMKSKYGKSLKYIRSCQAFFKRITILASRPNSPTRLKRCLLRRKVL